MNQNIRVIFFDLGGTFRIIRKDKEYAFAAKKRITELVGTDMEPEAFQKLIDSRYDVYREWALKYMCEAPEDVLWTRWLTPEFDRERITSAASELTYELRKVKGERLVVDGGVETVKELDRRGYTLGIISDLVGVHEVDEWLDRDDLRKYFKTVQQSSITLLRKPHPAIYYYAMHELGALPENCAYVGDNLNRDIIGAKASGLGMTVAVEYPNMPALKLTPENMPDAKISAFPQLLDIFPACGKVDSEKIIKP